MVAPTRQPAVHSWRAASSLATAAILLAIGLAIVTRLVDLAHVEFRYDEAMALGEAQRILKGQSLPQVGIGSSLGLPNPPFFVFLMALPLVIGPSPELATGFIGLLNICAILLMARLARSHFGDAAAAVAALLYATAPWAIVYSRQIWGQDATPFFLVLALLLLFHGTLADRPVVLAPSLICLALATQLHLSAFALAPLWVLALLPPGRRGRRLLWAGVGAALAAALYAPYLAWQADHGWPLLNRPSPGLSGAWSTDALAVAAGAIGGFAYGAKADLSSPVLGSIWHVLGIAILLAIGLGVLRLAWRVGTDSTRRWPSMFVLVWLILPVLAFLRPTVQLFPHYFIALLPAAYITAGIGLSPIGGGAKRGKGEQAKGSGPLLFRNHYPDFASALPSSRLAHFPTVLACALALGAAVVGMASFAGYIQAVDTGRITIDGYGPPLASRREAIQLALDSRSGNEPILVTANYNDGAVYRYLLEADRVPAIFLDEERLLAVPSGKFGVYILTNDTSPVANILKSYFPPSVTGTIRPDPQQSVSVVRVPEGSVGKMLADSTLQRTSARFANGMELLAAEASAEGKQVNVLLIWRVSGQPSGPAPQSFNRLFEGDKWLAQKDGPTLVPAEWSADYVLATPFTIEAPSDVPAGVHVSTGLYYLSDMKRVPLVDGGDEIEVAVTKTGE